MDKPSKPNFLYMQTRWDNVVQKDQKLVAIIDSLINHSCIATSKKLLVGSQLRICTSSGQWSGTEPYCLDPQELPKPLATKSSSTLSIFMSIISTIVVIALVAALLYYVLKMGYLRQVSIPKLTIPKINIQRPSTIRRQTESPGYGNEGTVAENNSHLSDSSTAPQQHQQQQQPLPKQRLTKINEHLPVFSKGTEFLVEAEDED
ncbi:CUB and sushi domain-containing protein 3-like [Oppia nitens]|uniref:CUB and sushi domain-containing protein 3-like n=1 Tax=Oppia nitens TaxID=1686743 RepID=UPI0023D9B82F|nr:CUB and sushi domain-containing protein 3-like [Oppia nitens]